MPRKLLANRSALCIIVMMEGFESEFHKACQEVIYYHKPWWLFKNHLSCTLILIKKKKVYILYYCTLRAFNECNVIKILETPKKTKIYAQFNIWFPFRHCETDSCNVKKHESSTADKCFIMPLQ